MAPKLDRDALHQFLWDRTNRWGNIKIVVAELAEKLDLTDTHLGRILKEMVGDGRMRVSSVGKSGIKTYRITDPAEWEPEEAAPARREIQWG